MDLTLKDINNFHYTTRYFKMYNFLITDGVKYLCDNGYFWLVSDALIAINSFKLHDKSYFLSVHLELKGDNKAVMRIEDGNYNVLYEQKYSYTDAQKNIEFYVIDYIAVLPSEY